MSIFYRGRHRGNYEPQPEIYANGIVILHIPQRQWRWSRSLQMAVCAPSTVIIEPSGVVHQFPSLWYPRRCVR